MKLFALATISLLSASARAETPLSGASSSPPELEKAVAAWASRRSHTVPTHEFALVDLNGDSIPDAVVLITDNIWCGTGGCTLVLFKGTASGFKYVSGSVAVREPIRLLSETRYGWRSISVLSAGGGGPTAEYFRISFNGSRYRKDPRSVTSSEKTSAKQLVLEK